MVSISQGDGHMDVNEAEVTEGRGRRRHSAEFKARLVGECRQPGMSVARVARDNGVNANLLHQWIGNSRAGDVDVLPKKYGSY
jgi:transposase-like protein